MAEKPVEFTPPRYDEEYFDGMEMLERIDRETYWEWVEGEGFKLISVYQSGDWMS